MIKNDKEEKVRQTLQPIFQKSTSSTCLNNDIFICTEGDYSITKVKTDRDLYETFGELGFGTGYLVKPKILDSDSTCCLLIGENDSNALQILRPYDNEHSWADLDIDENIMYPCTAAVAETGILFCTENDPEPKLYMCY